MTLRFTSCVLAALAAPALAEETRQLDAHEHGVGALNIAFDAGTVAMEFTAPGADIVGFEYAAKSEEDRAAVDTAVATLARPLDLFVIDAAAGCSVTQASAGLKLDADHDDHEDHAEHKEHGHEDHAEHKEHDHEDHAEHKEHDHEDHAEHKEHGHEDHAEHKEHGHEDHAEASHSEFQATYQLTCADPAAIDQITFAYFETFANARELEVQVLTDSGAKAFEVLRDAPTLDLRGMF